FPSPTLFRSPVTPTTATCLALATSLPAGASESSISREALKTALRALLERLEEAGAPVARVPRMRALRTQRARLEGERPVRSAELVDLEDDLLRADQAEQTMEIALAMFARRRLVRVPWFD